MSLSSLSGESTTQPSVTPTSVLGFSFFLSVPSSPSYLSNMPSVSTSAIPPKVEEAFRLFQYVPYNALSIAA